MYFLGRWFTKTNLIPWRCFYQGNHHMHGHPCLLRSMWHQKHVPTLLFPIQWVLLLENQVFFKILFIYSWETERGRDIGRGRSRLPVGSPVQDSIPGPQTDDPMLNHWATQVSLQLSSLPLPSFLWCSHLRAEQESRIHLWILRWLLGISCPFFECSLSFSADYASGALLN